MNASEEPDTQTYKTQTRMHNMKILAHMFHTLIESEDNFPKRDK